MGGLLLAGSQVRTCVAGSWCLPVLKARRVPNRMHGGRCLRVIATDSKAPGDFAAFCEQSGDVLRLAAQDGGTLSDRPAEALHGRRVHPRSVWRA